MAVPEPRRTRRLVTLGLPLLGLALLGSVLSWAGPVPAVDAAGCDGARLGAAALDQAFARPGLGATDARAGFGGGDYQHAYPLPDGRVLWLFQDLFFSNDDDLRDTPDTAAHNAGLIQNGSCWTVIGGRGLDVIGDSLTVDSRSWFWPLDGEIGADGDLWIFMAEMENPSGTGAGPGTVPTGTWLARLDPVTLEVRSFAPAPNAGRQLYGWSVVSDGRYSYLYGHCYRQFVNPAIGPSQFDSSCMPQEYLARVPLGRFDLAPEYWNGTGWSSDAAAASPVFVRGAANPMSVQWFGDVFVSVTKIDDWWGTNVYIDRAPTPQGPWETVETISVVGRRKCSAGCGNYAAFLMPWLDDAGRLTIGLSNGGEFPLWRADASLYRPTFLSAAVPSPVPSRSAAAAPAFSTGAGTAGFVPVTPARLVDSRTAGAAITRFGTGAVQQLDLRSSAPTGATAVALNLTTDRSAGEGWVRAWPCDGTEPPTSNLNPVAGIAVTNAAIVPLGAGLLCFRSAQPTDLIVDLNGWLTTGSTTGLVPVAARRVLDTRTGAGGAARLGPNATVQVDVGTAVTTSAVVLNVTAVDPGATGYVTAWPCGSAQPVVSNLNPQAGATRPNLVNVTVGAGGRVCLFSSAATDLIVDVFGEYRPGATARYAALVPMRLLDTRSDPRPYHHGSVSYAVPVSGVVAAVTNVTVTQPGSAGYLTAYPCLTSSWPGTSNVNFGALETSANATLVTGGRGYACFAPSTASQVVVDVFGVWV